MGRYRTVVDMGCDELWDSAILGVQEELIGVTGKPEEPGKYMDEELRVCSTTLALVIGKGFSERNVARVEQKLVEKHDALLDYIQEMYALALQATVLVRIKHVEYL